MLPVHLTLKNFLSYQHASLDFGRLHTACICGANGAGKSSLLEAIGWVLWGKSRANTEDDVIHFGAQEAQVDFLFKNRGQTYRVVRRRVRGKSTALEFQLANSTSFTSLSQKGVRGTQEKILEVLRLDYETFVNSAYLRQGRADEFMLKGPSERKQILTNLLKLDQYDQLADRSRQQANQYRGMADTLEGQLSSLQEQAAQRAVLKAELDNLERDIASQRQLIEQAEQQLQDLQSLERQRQQWQQQILWEQQQSLTLRENERSLIAALADLEAQAQAAAVLLDQAELISQGYAQWQQLQQQVRHQGDKFVVYQRTTQQRQALQQQLDGQMNQLRDQIRELAAQRQAKEGEIERLTQDLTRLPEVEQALGELRVCRLRLEQLDTRHAQATPLLHRRGALQTQLARAEAQHQVQTTTWERSLAEYRTQLGQQAHLEAALATLNDQIAHLERRRNYQDRVKDKGIERRRFLEGLETQTQEYQDQLTRLSQQIVPLEEKANCPLCDQPLDSAHYQVIAQKHHAQQQELRDKILILQEQTAVAEREIEVLRGEYLLLVDEQTPYPKLLGQRGQLQNQIQSLQELQQQVLSLEQQLAQADASPEVQQLQAQMQELDQELAQLAYDERDHGLARSDLDRWRWAEAKHQELLKAQARLTQLRDQQAQLDARHAQLTADLEGLCCASPLQQQLQELDQQLTDLAYDWQAHRALEEDCREAQVWQLQHQKLCLAQQTQPEVQERLTLRRQELDQNHHQQAQLQARLARMQEQLAATGDPQPQISQWQGTLTTQRQDLERSLGIQGQKQQVLVHLEALEAQMLEQRQQLEVQRRQARIYQELSLAFGKKGIQALLLENILPYLEAQSNQILARLSAGQMHVEFVTQRAGSSKNQSAKTIETLDILIADAQDTRPYETYSGGEAFRINFAIRLALARLLARQSGTQLQILIVDEGFGTQDAEGCARLIEAINIIANDFACVLAITHMPQFREAFQARIEVSKTSHGSELTLLV